MMQLAPITVGALVFNAGDTRFTATGFENFRAVAKPRAELVPAGGAAGAVAIGPWDDSEAYYTLTGRIFASSQADLLTYRMQLLDALPATTDSPVIVGDYDGVDRAVYVRLYDRPDITIRGNDLRFSFPLVGLDPLKYGITGEGGTMGVFIGDEFYQSFTYDAAPTPDDAYLPFTLDTAPTPDDAYFVFTQVVASGPFPPAVVLNSTGDAVSRRLTIVATGPLTQGDWKLINERTGNELWADVELVAGQSVVFDNYTQTATMEGSNIDNLVFGDWLTFEPGFNTYRLVAGEESEGFADITEALPAYR
jgi:hypothetical protein